MKKVLKPKVKVTSLISHTSLRVSSIEDWYFDSSYSIYMTREMSYLEELRTYSNNYVTFGDGAKVIIKGIIKLVYSGLPNIDNVLLVEGLTANLINISHLCHQGIKVSFNKSECVISSQD